MKLQIPENYNSKLTIKQTEIAIKQIKDNFEKILSNSLNLTRVSAPLFVMPNSGINDYLNNIERPVKFEVKDISNSEVEIVHSLAKWKRMALYRYNFSHGDGLYTDMNAIRRDEELDNTHSIYVDQWDWELIINEKERTMETLETIVKKLFHIFKTVESYISDFYPEVKKYLPENVTFISTQELKNMYPDLSPKEREDKITEKYKAVFLTKIGGKLDSGERHDGRAPDYDDWSLNGDLLFWYPVLNHAMEVSSMGIRVDAKTLLYQLEISKCHEKKELEFHKMVLENKLPYTIGGGLGQSRICMFMLGKAHIGEVQATVWPDEMIKECEKNNIYLL